MKFKYFQPKSVEDQTRLLASHLPRGRVWNSKTGTMLWKLVYVMASALSSLSNIVYRMIFEFRIETSETFLEYWEESLGLVTDETLTIAERRSNIKAQLRKITVVSKEEWESQISKALGKPVKVYPAGEFVPDSCFYLPNPVPTPLYLVYPNILPQNRFVLYIDEINGTSEAQRVMAIIKKFKPTNVFAIIIDRDYFF